MQFISEIFSTDFFSGFFMRKFWSANILFQTSSLRRDYEDLHRFCPLCGLSSEAGVLASKFLNRNKEYGFFDNISAD